MAGMNGVLGGGSGGAGAMDIEPSTRDRTRGVKRQASESNLTDHDRFDLGKRLRALSIRTDEKRAAEKNSTPTFHKRLPSRNGVLSTGFRRDAAPYPPPHPHPSPGDGMDVDDTRNRVYIADLDAELSSSSDDEEKLVFLPDIEKRFSRLPAQVLQPSAASGSGGMEGPRDMVLYSDPKSLSVADEGQDSVRKAVVEARQRARERAKERQVDMERMYSSAVAEGGMVGGVETAHGYGDVGYVSPLTLDQEEEDPDAMDLG